MKKSTRLGLAALGLGITTVAAYCAETNTHFFARQVATHNFLSEIKKTLPIELKCEKIGGNKYYSISTQNPSEYPEIKNFVITGKRLEDGKEAFFMQFNINDINRVDRYCLPISDKTEERLRTIKAYDTLDGAEAILFTTVDTYRTAIGEQFTFDVIGKDLIKKAHEQTSKKEFMIPRIKVQDEHFKFITSNNKEITNLPSGQKCRIIQHKLSGTDKNVVHRQYELELNGKSIGTFMETKINDKDYKMIIFSDSLNALPAADRPFIFRAVAATKTPFITGFNRAITPEPYPSSSSQTRFWNNKSNPIQLIRTPYP